MNKQMIKDDLHSKIKNCKTGCWENYQKIVSQFAFEQMKDLPTNKNYLTYSTAYEQQNILNAFMKTQIWVEEGNDFNPCESHKNITNEFKNQKNNQKEKILETIIDLKEENIVNGHMHAYYGTITIKHIM